MLDILALVLAMVLVIVVGAVTVAVFFFAIDKLQAYGRDEK